MFLLCVIREWCRNSGHAPRMFVPGTNEKKPQWHELAEAFKNYSDNGKLISTLPDADKVDASRLRGAFKKCML